MSGINRLHAVEAAHLFIDKHFPHCQGAILAGSVVRGEATETSDLDLVIFDQSILASYRESYIAFDWAIEVFVHNLLSYKLYFESDVKRARPFLPKMVSEGIILKGKDVIEPIKKEAKELLDNGPEEWIEEMVKLKRYFITDALDDFVGCSDRAEELFIANTLAELVSEFVLRTNRKWVGNSKWIVRSLKNYNPEFTNAFVEAFDTYYKTRDKTNVIEVVEKVLKPFGGKLFEGFSLGKD